jgi:hypothetical protein
MMHYTRETKSPLLAKHISNIKNNVGRANAMKAFIGVTILLLFYVLIAVIAARAYRKMRSFPPIAKFFSIRQIS